MLNQSYTKNNLRLLKGKTLRKHFNGKDYEGNFLSSYDDIIKNINDSSYQFSDFKTKVVNGKLGYDCSTAADELVLKKLNDNIKRLFKIKTSDRHDIIKQTISLLHDSQPFSIIRLDIKNFYESINRTEVIDFVHNEWLLSHQSRIILKSFNNHKDFSNLPGLPRGLSISSTLSELKMRKFDKAIRKVDEIYFYSRFVDDIIIFCIGEAFEVHAKVMRYLKEINPELEFNEKTYIFDSNKDNEEINGFDYLGYRIDFKKINDFTKPREVTVSISPKKILKIKSRVQKTFISYNRTRNFKLLLARLKFLCGNQYIIGDIERTKLKSGIYYNYPLINTYHQLKDLDLFYQKLLRTKYKPISMPIEMIKRYKDNNNISSRYEKITNISFSFGFYKRVMNSFDAKTCKKIKGCW